MAKLPRINYPLVPLKIALFCWFGGAACLLPYMSVHMKELGFTVEETAIIYTLLPVIQLLGTPIAGFIADKLGQYKSVMLISAWITIITDIAILQVPPVRTTWEVPEMQLLQVPFVQPILLIDRCGQTVDCSSVNGNLTFKVSDCTNDCSGQKGNATNGSQDLLLHEFCQWTGEGYYSCVEYDGNATFTAQVFHSHNRTSSSVLKSFIPDSSCAYPLVSIEPVQARRGTVQRTVPTSNCTILCSLTLTTMNVSFPSDRADGDEPPVIGECEEIVGNRVVTFWSYFMLRIIFNLFNSICFTIVDSTALAMADVYGSNYGRERFWAILGTVLSPATGIMVDTISDHKGHLDYSPAFFCYCGLTVLTCVAAWHLDLCVVPEVGMLSNLRKVARVPPIIVLLLVLLWLGTVWGFIENFLFWFLEDLGCPNYLMGLTLTIGAVAGLPFLQWSGWFLQKVGHINLLVIALFVYFVRCFGYSYIWDPWWCIPFEMMEIFTYHLMWVAAATYSAHLTPDGLLATVQGCIAGVHYGVGPGSGSFIGGIIMSTYGPRAAFRVMGICSVVLCVTYGFLHYIWLRHHEVSTATSLAMKFKKRPDVKTPEELSNGTIDVNHEGSKLNQKLSIKT